MRQIGTFILVGASSTGVYFLLLWLLRDLIASTAVLAACCYAISMVYNYIMQSWVTFRAGPPTARSMTRFVIMHLTAMALNSLLMALLVDQMHVPLFLAQAMVTVVISAGVFVLSKRWVYRT